MSTFLLEIVTPERKVFAEQVDMVVVKGVEGDLGIMAGHIPLVTPLRISPVKIKMNGKDTWLAVHGGFIEVAQQKVVILAESAELPEDIDVDRAKAAMVRAEQRLKMNERSKKDHVDFRRAEVSLQRALTRIEVTKHTKR